MFFSGGLPSYVPFSAGSTKRGMVLSLLPRCSNVSKLSLMFLGLAPIHFLSDLELVRGLSACKNVIHLNLDGNGLNSVCGLHFLPSFFERHREVLPNLESLSVRSEKSLPRYNTTGEEENLLTPERVQDCIKLIREVRPKFKKLRYIYDTR